MSDTNDILSPNTEHDGRKGLPEEKLMAYLDGKLSPAEQHEVELWLADEGMESDALDGLSGIGADEMRHSVRKLNHGLRKSLSGKKRERRKPQAEQFTWIAILIILLVIIVAYLVIRKSM